MAGLEGSQRKYLRGLAHHLRPLVQVGKVGLTDRVGAAVETALDSHELVKVQFVGDARVEKKPLATEIEVRTGAECVGTIGHMAIYYRQQADPEKRRIRLPS